MTRKAVVTVDAQQQARDIGGKMRAADRGDIFEALQQFGDALIVRFRCGVLRCDSLGQVVVEKFVERFRGQACDSGEVGMADERGDARVRRRRASGAIEKVGGLREELQRGCAGGGASLGGAGLDACIGEAVQQRGHCGGFGHGDGDSRSGEARTFPIADQFGASCSLLAHAANDVDFAVGKLARALRPECRIQSAPFVGAGGFGFRRVDEDERRLGQRLEQEDEFRREFNDADERDAEICGRPAGGREARASGRGIGEAPCAEHGAIFVEEVLKRFPALLLDVRGVRRDLGEFGKCAAEIHARSAEHAPGAIQHGGEICDAAASAGHGPYFFD